MVEAGERNEECDAGVVHSPSLYFGRTFAKSMGAAISSSG